MTFRCSSVIHDCAPGNDTTFPFDIKFFDLTDPVHPRFIGSYVSTDRAGVHVKPHEMYLWVDPKDSDRALLWLSTPTASDPNTPNMMIADISDVPGSFHETGPAPVGTAAPVTEVAEGNWNQFFPGSSVPANYDFDLALHSMAPTADGKKTYLAYLRGGFGILDTSAVVNHRDDHHFVSLNDKLLTPVRNFVRWGAGNQCAGHTAVGCSESHSAVPVPGRPFELSIDEVYGTFTAPSFGWPWGWARLINVAHPNRPHLVGEYKIFGTPRPSRGAPATTPRPSSSRVTPRTTRQFCGGSRSSHGTRGASRPLTSRTRGSRRRGAGSRRHRSPRWPPRTRRSTAVPTR